MPELSANGPVELNLLALIERLRKERDRLAGLPGFTERLGGLTALGQRVEGLLRAVFEAQCAAVGEPAERAFPTVTEAALRYDRASAGQVAYAVVAHAARHAPADARVVAIVAELRGRESVLGALVELRNATVHARAEAPKHELLALLDRALARLIPMAATPAGQTVS